VLLMDDDFIVQRTSQDSGDIRP